LIVPDMNCLRSYALQSLAAGSVISYSRICRKSTCIAGSAVSAV
jgi:hypothetical protein